MPYPDSFTTITIPDGADPLATGSHTEVHQAEVDAIGRIEQVLGLDPAGSSSTVADRLDGLGASIDELAIGKENAGTAASLVAAATAALEQQIGELTAADVGADPAGSAAAVGDALTAHEQTTTGAHGMTAFGAGLVAAANAAAARGDLGVDPAGTAATAAAAAQAAAISSSAASLTAHMLAADPHTVYQLKADRGVANGYASLNAEGQVESSQIVLSTSDCGSGVDGDLVVSTTINMPRDMRYGTITMMPGGKIVCDVWINAAGGWVLRARVLDLTNADPYCIAGKFSGLSGGSGFGTGGAGGTGAAAAYYAGTAGGGTRNVAGGAGGTGAGAVGGNAPTGVALGGYVRLAGAAGGAGASGAGGAGGTAGSGSPGVEPTTVPSEPCIMWGASASGGGAITLGNGGLPGAGGGGGGGDGTAGGGGGASGPGTKPMDIRIGRLIVGPSTGLPIVDGRGGNGGAGGTPPAGNRGGGGGGGGAGGTRVHLSIGEIVLTGGVTLPLVDAIDASGGSGGNGGDGTGTGIGGGGGPGGPGGAIYYRRRGGAIVDLDERGIAGTAGGAAVGNTGGTGGVGRSTKANIS